MRSALNGVAPEPAATAELLTGELVTNVVVHARTGAEVRVAVAEGRVRVRVRVCDRRPERGLVPHARHPYASTAPPRTRERPRPALVGPRPVPCA